MIQKLKQNISKLEADLEHIETVEKTIVEFRSELETLKQDIDEFYIFNADLPALEESLKVIQVFCIVQNFNLNSHFVT